MVSEPFLKWQKFWTNKKWRKNPKEEEPEEPGQPRRTSPVLDYLATDDLPSFGALGPVSMLKAFAKSIGRKFIKGHAFSERLWPERT